MSKPIILAFANQKGGAGKSTIGTHVASALSYIYGYKVAMADFDNPQHSLVAYRREDEVALAKDSKLQERFLRQGKPLYPVIKSSVEQATDTLEALEKIGYDFILVDTPGTLNILGLTDLLESIDYIFLPMEADKGTIASTMAYMEILTRFLNTNKEESNLKGFYAFWNKYMKSERKAVYEKVTSHFEQTGLPMLNTRVEQLLTYRDNRSTAFSLSERELDRLGLGRLIMEVLAMVVGEGQLTPSGAKIAYTATTVDEPTELAAQENEATPANNEIS
jgi:cellulose biosynthesis protein BcsQ